MAAVYSQERLSRSMSKVAAMMQVSSFGLDSGAPRPCCAMSSGGEAGKPWWGATSSTQERPELGVQVEGGRGRGGVGGVTSRTEQNRARWPERPQVRQRRGSRQERTWWCLLRQQRHLPLVSLKKCCLLSSARLSPSPAGRPSRRSNGASLRGRRLETTVVQGAARPSPPVAPSGAA
ncbi:uncharacterized protein [Triticum aestivum]|uniref:uncharacterized protein n=1 Tax=Triticum aestivum TaxID=4565 RepID=UPI001D02892C|nr:uncharacterized protein LOC123086152 [Triticum aestivum]